MTTSGVRRAVLGLSFIGALAAGAADVQWSGGIGGGANSAWLVNTNWFPTNTVPLVTDAAVFGVTGSASVVGINMTAATGAVQVGMISLVAGTNRTIENSSATTGTLTLAGVGGVLLSNGTTSAGLNFRNGTAPVLLRLALGTSGVIFVNSGAVISSTNVVITETNGSRSVTKLGGGSLILGATNLWSGGTVIVGGPNSQTSAAIHLLNYPVLGGGTITLSNTVSMTPLYFMPVAGVGTLSNNVVLSGTAGITTRLLVGSANTQIATLGGVISGGEATSVLLMDNDTTTDQGRIRFSNAGNSFRVGTINLNRGGFVFDSDGALGNTNNTLRLDVLSLDPTTGLIFGNNATLPASRTISVATMTRIDSQSFTGTVLGVITNNAALRKGGAGDLILNGAVSGSGGFTVEAGTLVLNATNTLTGGHTNAATLALGVDGALGSGQLDLRGAGGVTRSADAAARTVGNNLNIATDTTFGSPGTGNLLFNGATAANGGGAKRLAVSNTLTTINNVFNGAGAVTKSGPGTLALGGTNTMSGALTIAEGTLVLTASGRIASVPTISVSNGAVFDVSALSGGITFSNQMLEGFGTVTGNVFATGSSQVRPGGLSLAGTLTVNGNVGFGGGPTLVWNLTNNTVAGGGNDLLVATNAAEFNPGGVSFQIMPSVPLVTGVYRLVEYSGTKTSLFNTAVLGNTTRSTWTLDEGTAGQINLVVAGTNESLVWSANTSADWDTATTNWTVAGGATTTRFFNGDAVLFDDSGAASNVVNITTALVAPLSLRVDSSSNYTFSGTGSVGDTTPGLPLVLAKSGSGTLTILNLLSNTGGAVVSNGTLQVGGGGGVGQMGAGTLTVEAAGSLVFFRSNLATTVANAMAGSGTVVFMGSGASNENGYVLGGINTNFAGTMVVTNARISLDSVNDVGGPGSTIVVKDGGGVFHTTASLGRPLTISGKGWLETSGQLGALRVEGVSWTAPVMLAANARIAAFGNNGTVSGTISGPYELELWNGSAVRQSVTLTPTNPNTYGSLRISSNMVAVAGNANAFSTGPVILNGGTQRLAGFSFAFSNLSSTAAGGTVANSAADFSTLTIGADDTSTLFSGKFENTGAGGINVTKVGAGTLTLNGANLNTGNFTIQTGAIALGVSGSFTNTAVVVLAGGNFDVTAKGGYTPNHVIRGSGSVSGTLHLATTSALIPETGNSPGTISIGGNLDMAATYTNRFDLTNSVVTGSGINDLIAVNGNLEPSNSVIAINVLAPLVNGTNTLFTYTGTKLSSLNPAVLGNTTRKSWTLDETGTVGQVNLVVAGDYATLSWLPQPAGNGLWDLGTTNWFNAGSLATDRFFQVDSVVFDDAGAYSNIVTLSGQLLPTAVTVNSASNYTFTGAGRISSNATILKAGSGKLTVNTTNDFVGTVWVNDGVLALGNAAALGSSFGPTIVSNATLDLQNSALKTGLERVQIIGNGVGSTGAVIATGAVNTDNLSLLSLLGDASVGAWPAAGRWDLRGPSAFAGELNLNGFTLTKVGPGRVSLIDSMITNSGSIVVTSGLLEMSRSAVSGPGSISLLPGTTLFFENYSAGSVTKLLTMDFATNTIAGNVFVLGSPVILTNANTFVASLNLTLTNVVSGPGSLIKTGASNLILTASNTYAGGTIVSSGILQIGVGGDNGSVQGAISNNATVLYQRSDSILANPISGAGNLNVNVASGLVFDASNPMTGRQNVNVPFSGTGRIIIQPGASIVCSNLHFGNQATFPGTGAQNGGDVVIGANLRVGHWPTETSTFVMAGGTLTITNNSGTANYSAGVTEQPGGLYVGVDGTGIFIQTGGVVRCEGVVVDNRTDTPGTDTLVLEGGTLEIGRWGIASGTNATYSILLGGGTLSAHDNWTSTRLMALTGTNGDTVVNSSGYTLTFAASVSGAGGLLKSGGGSLLLNASNTFVGAATVSGGNLFGTGSVNSAVSVGSNGVIGPVVNTITGTFTVASLTITNGGTVSAHLLGTSATIRVTGDFNSAPGSSVQLIPVGAVALGTHVLVDYDGTFNGSVGDFAFTVPGGGQGYLTNDLANTSLDVVITNLGTGIKWDGLVNSTWKHGGPQNWKGVPGGTPAAYSLNDNVLFDDTATGTTTVNITEVVSPSSVVVSNDTKDYVWSGGGISGGIGLSKDGAARLTISGSALSYTNTTTVSAGTLTLDSLALFSSSIANASTVELAAASANWAVQTGRTLSGGGTFTKTGAGVVSLSNATITASGLIQVQQGTLRNDGNAVDWNASAASMDISTAARFDMRGDATRIASLTGSGLITNSFGNTATEILRVGADDTSGNFSGVIQDSGTVGAGEGNGTITLMKIGLGTQVVSAADSVRVRTTLDRGSFIPTADQPSVKALVFGASVSSTNLPYLDLTAASLTATSWSNHIHSATTSRVDIGIGRVLTINGPVTIGSPSTDVITRQLVTGPGSFVVSHTNTFFKIGSVGSTPANNSSQATLDLTTLAHASINIGAGALTLGAGDNSTRTHALLLAATNTITAGTVNVGSSTIGGQQVLQLGSVSNRFNVDNFQIGNAPRDWGLVSFGGASGSMVLRDRSGTGRSAFSMGPLVNQGTAYPMTNLFDTTGHSADLFINTLTIGLFPHGTNSPTVTNTFLFNQGTLDATTIRMAVNANGANGNAATMVIGGGTVNIGTGGVDISSNGFGVVQFNGGTISSLGNITRGTPTNGIGRGTFILNGATLDMNGNRIGGGTGYTTLTTLSLESGTLANVGEIQNGAAWTKSAVGTLVLAGTNLFTGAVTLDAGTLLVNGSKLGAGGVTVNAATLGGNGFIAGQIINVSGTVAPGTSVGRLTALGDFVNGANLDIELAGLVPGTGHDQLVVVSNAFLAGTLNVTTNSGFVPAAGNTFTVLTATAVSGTFGGVNTPALADPNLGWFVEYQTNAIILSVTGAPPAAPSGYNAFSNTYALTTGPEADQDGDGYANLLEYVTGANPTNTDALARMNASRTNNLFALKFTRDTNAVDATLIVEGANATTNNATWTGIATNLNGSWGGATNVTEGAGSPASVTACDPATNRFLRLRVTRP